MTTLSRGPIELNISKSELSWTGAEDHRFSLRLSPGRLKALHALFLAAYGLREHEPVTQKRVLEVFREVYPAETMVPATLTHLIQQTNRALLLEDEEMTYRLLTGQYHDRLTFQWSGRFYIVDEDQFTVLTKLSEKANDPVSRPELLAELIKSNPRWESRVQKNQALGTLIGGLKTEFPDLPIETLRDRGFRWIGQSRPEDIWKFRGFELDVRLQRLRWEDGGQTREIRLKPIECAVLKERFKHGDRPISWRTVGANPTEERLINVSVIALRVHFANVRKRVLDRTPSANDRFNSQ